MQLSNSIPQGKLSSKSEKLIFDQYEVNILCKPIHFDPIYHFACLMTVRIPIPLFATCALFPHLDTL